MPDAGPCIVAYADSADGAQYIVDELHEELAAAENKYRNVVWQPDAAIVKAMANDADRRSFLPTRRTIRARAAPATAPGRSRICSGTVPEGAVVAIVTDAEFAAAAHACGIGGTFAAALGGKLGQSERNGVQSLHATFRVLALGDGKLVCTGPVSFGARMNLGAMALVAVEDAAGADVKIVISSVRSQPLDQAMLRHVGIEPAGQRIIVLKSSVHFRADFDPPGGPKPWWSNGRGTTRRIQPDAITKG